MQRVGLLMQFWTRWEPLVTEGRDSDYELKVCSAIITKHVKQNRGLLEDSRAEQLSAELLSELRRTALLSSAARLPAVARLTYFLPAWLQYVAQRFVLLSPRFSHWLLRKTRLHHRWY